MRPEGFLPFILAEKAQKHISKNGFQPQGK
jgi:hypothetical protein